MARQPVDFLRKILTIVDAWETMRPDLVLFRMTFHQFKRAVMPSFVKRADIEEARAVLSRLIAERDAADRHTSRMILRVVNAVKGMPDEGEDGELYAAMGYMTWSRKCDKVRQAKAEKIRRASVQAANDHVCPGDGERDRPSPGDIEPARLTGTG